MQHDQISGSTGIVVAGNWSSAELGISHRPADDAEPTKDADNFRNFSPSRPFTGQIFSSNAKRTMGRDIRHIEPQVNIRQRGSDATTSAHLADVASNRALPKLWAITT